MDRHDPDSYAADAQERDAYSSEASERESYSSEASERELNGSEASERELYDEPQRIVHRASAPRTPWAALGLDAALVILFAGLGRLSHAEGMSFLGLLGTAVPFLAGTLAGWAVLLWRRPARPASLTGGAIVWLSTVVIGMIVRVLAGGSTAVTFILVSLVVTGLFLMGWRALGGYLVRRSTA